MTTRAKVFMNGRSQAVRLPLDFRFTTKEVYIRKDEKTGDVILSEKPRSWDDFFALADEASEEAADFLIPRESEDEQYREIF
jgi:antitoxin VapB